MQDPTVMQGALMCILLIFIVHPRTALIFDDLDPLEAPLGPAALRPRGEAWSKHHPQRFASLVNP